MQYIVGNLQQDFMAGMHCDFFQWQIDRVLFYWLNHSWYTRLSKQEVEEGSFVTDFAGINKPFILSIINTLIDSLEARWMEWQYHQKKQLKHLKLKWNWGS